MRDRLSHLHEAQNDSEGFSTIELDDLSEQGAAAAAWSNQDQDLDGVLQEAQHIRLEIQHIQHDISDLRDIHYQALNITSDVPDATKRDSNEIAADIKRRGEAVLQQLHRMNALSREVEAQRGSTDPVGRIAQTQYQCLNNALREAMSNYNDTEMSHREACKRQIQRQMDIVGRDVTEGELEEVMESGRCNVFSIQAEGKTARSALIEIESRHKELQELEQRIKWIQELFLDVAVLTEEQGAVVENTQINVQNTEATIQEAIVRLETAKTYDKKNPCKQLFCCCFPCIQN
ncbi:syntaxin-11-like [Diretmus argenteus]